MTKYTAMDKTYVFPEIGTRFRNKRTGTVSTVEGIIPGTGDVKLRNTRNQLREKWLPHLLLDYEEVKGDA